MHTKMHTVIKKAFSSNEFNRFRKGFDSPQLHHIKEQSLIQKQPSKLEGCFCIYARKA